MMFVASMLYLMGFVAGLCITMLLIFLGGKKPGFEALMYVCASIFWPVSALLLIIFVLRIFSK